MTRFVGKGGREITCETVGPAIIAPLRFLVAAPASAAVPSRKSGPFCTHASCDKDRGHSQAAIFIGYSADEAAQNLKVTGPHLARPSC
jgi:hypothetical protein